MKKKLLQDESSKMIKNNLSHLFKRIYNSYNYLKLDEEKYNTIVLEEIEKTKKIKSDDYVKNLEINMHHRMNEMVLHELKSNSETFLLNYLTSQITYCHKVSDAFRNYNQLNSFLSKYNYAPNIDTLMYLINNNKVLNKTVEMLYADNNIISNNVNDELLESLKGAYCTVNNIDIDLNDDIKEYNCDDNSPDLDSTKMYLQEIHKIPLLTTSEERELFIRYRNGDLDAKKEIIERNLRLVVSVARHYKSNRLTLLDKVQEGNFGLIKAVDRFDVDKNYKFSTYAIWWIRQTIERAINNYDRLVRLPIYLSDRIKRINSIIDKYEKAYGREPTAEEIAKELKISVSSVLEIKKNMQETVSINTPIGDEKETELADFIPQMEIDTEQNYIDENLIIDFTKFFDEAKLTEKERDILYLRYGFNDEDPKTLEEIGKKYHVTRERIRQIQAKALNKLRLNPNINNFSNYMSNPDRCLENIQNMRSEYYGISIEDEKEEKNPDTKKRGNKMVNKTIYKYFNAYSKQKIDSVIAELSEEERNLITKRYGNDLNKPVETSLTKEEYAKFYGGVIPKIRRRLEGIQPKISKKKEEKIEVLETELKENNIEITDKTELKEENRVLVEKNEEDKELDTLLSLFRTPKVLEYIQTMPPKEATIIYLKLGFVNGKRYTTIDIAEFLDITTFEVREVTKKFLLGSKDIITASLDDVITEVINKTK